VGAIDLFLLIGALIAALANNSLSKYSDQSGWIIATAIQAIPPFLILFGLPFTPGRKTLSELLATVPN
jgi:SP family sugar:H+ symporter-like MFS transporter